MEISKKGETTGPLFRGTATHILRQVTQSAVEDLAEKGESFLLLKQLRPRPAGAYKSGQEAGKDKSTGTYAKNIQSIKGNLNVIVTDGGKVLYGPWLEGEGSRNKSSRFPGYFSFRKAKQLVDKQVDGTMQKHLNKFTRRMNA